MGTFNVTDGGGNPILGTISVTNDNKRGVFTPSAPLPNGTTVHVEVTTGVTSPNGVPMAVPFNSTFQTVAVDNPPVILQVTPPDGSTNVPITQINGQPTEIVIDFAEPIAPTTLN